ncbi:MAG: hypothetical protein KDA80_11695, partial [Planctomycetaceae bacterium]|nr:hypothetical protein [Planctomycetaceae bacterium]
MGLPPWIRKRGAGGDQKGLSGCLQRPEARQNVSGCRQAPVSGLALNDRPEGSAETSSWIGSVGL